MEGLPWLILLKHDLKINTLDTNVTWWCLIRAMPRIYRPFRETFTFVSHSDLYRLPWAFRTCTVAHWIVLLLYMFVYSQMFWSTWGCSFVQCNDFFMLSPLYALGHYSLGFSHSSQTAPFWSCQHSLGVEFEGHRQVLYSAGKSLLAWAASGNLIGTWDCLANQADLAASESDVEHILICNVFLSYGFDTQLQPQISEIFVQPPNSANCPMFATFNLLTSN